MYLAGWGGLRPDGQKDNRIIDTCDDLESFQDNEGCTAHSPLPDSTFDCTKVHCSKRSKELIPGVLGKAERVMVRWLQEEPRNRVQRRRSAMGEARWNAAKSGLRRVVFV